MRMLSDTIPLSRPCPPPVAGQCRLGRSTRRGGASVETPPSALRWHATHQDAHVTTRHRFGPDGAGRRTSHEDPSISWLIALTRTTVPVMDDSAAPMGMPAGSGIPAGLMLIPPPGPSPLTVLSDDVSLHDGSGNVRREVDAAKSIAQGTVVGRHMVHRHATPHRRRHGTMRYIARHTPSRKNRIASLANAKTSAVPRPIARPGEERRQVPPPASAEWPPPTGATCNSMPRGHAQSRRRAESRAGAVLPELGPRPSPHRWTGERVRRPQRLHPPSGRRRRQSWSRGARTSAGRPPDAPMSPEQPPLT